MYACDCSGTNSFVVLRRDATLCKKPADMTLSVKKWPILFFAQKQPMILLRPFFHSNKRPHANFDFSSIIFQYFLSRQLSILKILFEKFKAIQKVAVNLHSRSKAHVVETPGFLRFCK